MLLNMACKMYSLLMCVCSDRSYLGFYFGSAFFHSAIYTVCLLLNLDPLNVCLHDLRYIILTVLIDRAAMVKLAITPYFFQFYDASISIFL